MLLDEVRHRLQLKHYSRSTEAAYVHWITQYILFHGKKHPREMGEQQIRAFLLHLARRQQLAPATQNQAFAAILFLYKWVLAIELPSGIRPSLKAPERKTRPPNVLSRGELRGLFSQLGGQQLLVCQLLYGSGLRLAECLRLRVADLDFDRALVTVIDGKVAIAA